MPVVSERELKYIVRMNDQTARERDAINKGLGGIGSTADSVGAKLEKMAQALVASAAFKQVVGFAKNAVNAFAESEAAAQRLSVALELRGMQGSAESLNALADATQRLTGIDGDQVTQIMAQLVAQGKSEAQVKKMIIAARALSAVNEEDLGTSIEKLNGTLAGQARELGRNNESIRNLTEEQLKAGDAIDIVIQQYGKFVGKTGETQIAMNVAKESVGDMVEAIGSTLAPVVQGGAAVIGLLADSLAKAHPIIKLIVGIVVGGMIGAFAAMTVKTIALTAAKWGLFASEMALNAAMAVTNPLIWAGIAAAGIMVGGVLALASAKQAETLATNESTRALGQYIVQARAASELAQNATNPFGSRTVGAFNPVNMQGVEELRKYIASLQAARQLNLATPTPMRQSGFGGALTVDQAAVDRLAKELENIDAELSTAQSRMGDLYTSGIDRLKSVVSSSSSELDNLQRQLEEVKATAANGQDQALKTQAIAIINAKIKAVLDKQAETAREAAENANSYLESLRGNLIRQKGDRLGILELERTAALAEMRKRLTDTEQIAKATTLIEQYYASERLKIAREGLEKFQKYAKTESNRISPESTNEIQMLLEGDLWGALGAAIGKALDGWKDLQDILNPITTAIREIFVVLGPVLNQILVPILGIIKVLAIAVAQILVPILAILVPAIDALAAVFVWVYNEILLPIGNALIALFNTIYIAISSVVNWIIDGLEKIPGVKLNYRMEERTLDQNGLTRIDPSALRQAGSSISSSAMSGGGGGASYAAGTTIKIDLIEIKADFIAGDAGLMDVAIMLRDKIAEAERIGR